MSMGRGIGIQGDTYPPLATATEWWPPHIQSAIEPYASYWNVFLFFFRVYLWG